MKSFADMVKQAQKMQKKIESLQLELAEKVIEVSSGGGAVVIEINGQSEFKSIKIDPELLKEDAGLVEDTLLQAVQEASSKAKAFNEEEMAKATQGMSMPGFM
jgi:DNA-binding YbaB/EbfC family protein